MAAAGHRNAFAIRLASYNLMFRFTDYFYRGLQSC
jgi:hypothetical protein